MWDAAKDARGLIAIQKRFPCGSQLARDACAVDIVAQEGEQWIKISAISESRLISDVDEAGFWGAESESGSDYETDSINDGTTSGNNSRTARSNGSTNENNSAKSSIPLFRMAQKLRLASLSCAQNSLPPRTDLYLPNVSTNPHPVLIPLFDSISSLGIRIRLGPLPASPPSIFPALLADPQKSLTPILNLDCTILVALVSAISHHYPPDRPSYPLSKDVADQFAREAEERMLPEVLYPALSGHELVCDPIFCSVKTF